MPIVDLPQASISIPPEYVGAFTRAVQPLYGQLATKPLPAQVSAPAGLRGLVGLVYGAAPYTHHPTPDPPCFTTQTDEWGADGRVLVGYSGGKDSLATALYLRAKGWQPHLYYVRGLNRSYPREEQAVQDTAYALCCPLVMPTVKLVGNHSWPDHPIKDQLILAMMADYGLNLGICRYTMGVETSCKLAESNIDYNWSDAVEMFNAFVPWVQASWAGFNWRWVLRHHTESYAIINQHAPHLLPLTTSCVTPHRFQAMRKAQKEAKYGIQLMDNRCGTCWKCCVCYLTCGALGWHGLDPAFAAHCLRVFKANLPGAYGATYMNGATWAELLQVAVDPRWVPQAAYAVLLEIANAMGME